MCNLYSSFLVYRQFYARANLVCIRKTIISSSALACRRAGSKRITNVSSCVKNIIRRNVYVDNKCC